MTYLGPYISLHDYFMKLLLLLLRTGLSSPHGFTHKSLQDNHTLSASTYFCLSKSLSSNHTMLIFIRLAVACATAHSAIHQHWSEHRCGRQTADLWSTEHRHHDAYVLQLAEHVQAAACTSSSMYKQQHVQGIYTETCTGTLLRITFLLFGTPEIGFKINKLLNNL